MQEQRQHFSSSTIYLINYLILTYVMKHTFVNSGVYPPRPQAECHRNVILYDLAIVLNCIVYEIILMEC